LASNTEIDPKIDNASNRSHGSGTYMCYTETLYDLVIEEGKVAREAALITSIKEKISLGIAVHKRHKTIEKAIAH
jgi:hypothetical protein